MSTKPLLRLESPKYYTRLTQLCNDQDYGIGRTTLVKRWKILTPGITAILKVNDIPIIIDGMDGINFDIPWIRGQLRDIIPCSSEENMLCNAEATLFGTQLLGLEYYRYFSTSFLFNYIFTGELCMSFVLTSVDGILPERVDIEEEYILSEVQLLHRLSQGETLEGIDKNNRDLPIDPEKN